MSLNIKVIINGVSPWTTAVRNRAGFSEIFFRDTTDGMREIRPRLSSLANNSCSSGLNSSQLVAVV